MRRQNHERLRKRRPAMKGEPNTTAHGARAAATARQGHHRRNNTRWKAASDTAKPLTALTPAKLAAKTAGHGSRKDSCESGSQGVLLRLRKVRRPVHICRTFFATHAEHQPTRDEPWQHDGTVHTRWPKMSAHIRRDTWLREERHTKPVIGLDVQHATRR